MAVPSNFTNMMNPQLPVDQSIYEQDSTQRTRLGTRIQVGDRVFYYAQLSTSANVSAGDVLVANAIATTAMNATIAVDATAAGKRTVTITAGTNIAANFFAEGYMCPSSQGLLGAGIMYRIANHASFGSGSATCVLNLYDPIISATMSAGNVVLFPSPYSAAKVAATGLSDIPVGVAPIPVTTGNYFWMQTWGIAPVKMAAANALGAVLHLGATGGAACNFDATTNGGIAGITFQIGKNYHLIATATNIHPVLLTIQP
jgi:hypothetical protein